MSLAMAADVADRWRPLSAEEEALACVLITDAEGIIRIRVPTLDARIADESLPAAVVTGVIARMVLRVMRNPDGKIMEGIDDYTYRRADAVAEGLLYLGADDLGLLSPSGGTGAAFTIRPSGEPGYSTTSDISGWTFL